MKHLKYLLAFLFIWFHLVLSAQNIIIKVDTIFGCNPSTAKFSFTTTLTSASPILWNFGNGTTSPDSTAEVQYTHTGDYTIKLTLNGTNTDSVSISIPACVPTSLDSVPNVFTPNGDGINDQFKVKYDADKVISLKVFTRAGIMILNTQGKLIIWDGKLESGDLVSPGLYYYIIEIKGASPPVTKKGFFYVFY